jgi:glycosyltransferase involved in cell wall biosynthesis
MKILSLTAGAAGMYCGSCLRDNALAAELVSRGHEVTLVPLYTPTTTDEANLSRDEVLFGGVSVYLQQHVPWFRKTPRFLDRVWDSPWVIRTFASRSVSTDPKLLGELTISMLEGERGVLRKEFDKLLEWLGTEPTPDIVNLPNSLLIGLAEPLGKALNRPVCCTLQGEDLFLNGLVEPYRDRVLALIRERVKEVDCFIAVSDYYAPIMSRLLRIPRERIAVVPLGISLAGYDRRGPGDDTFRVGYFARVAPEKGLHLLAEAYVQFRRRTAGTKARLEAAGYLSPAQVPYLDSVKRSLETAGLLEEFTYRGALDRGEKLAFLRALEVFSVPATYDEPKGVFLLEAMASGVPVVQPRRGAFIEIVEKTGGGLLVAPDDATALAEGLLQLLENRAMARGYGERGNDGVRAHYSIATSADSLLDVYEKLMTPASHPMRAV